MAVPATIPVLKLAKVLYNEMEALDPAENCEWEDLTESEREFYVLLIQRILVEKKTIEQFFAQPKAPTYRDWVEKVFIPSLPGIIAAQYLPWGQMIYILRSAGIEPYYWGA